MDGLSRYNDLFGGSDSITRTTERGELLKKFAAKTEKPIGFIAYKLTGIPTPDLYYIEKQCDTYKGPWSKAFFGMLKSRSVGA